MTLDDRLKIAVIEDLKRVNINMLNDYVRENGSTLNFLYNRGTIDNSLIEEGLEHAIVNQAKQDIITMAIRRDCTLYPDHLGRPECLAYALEKGKLSEKQIKKINFDHGKTAETFSWAYYTKNLLSILRIELLNLKYLKLS